jgi:uncharacterized protein (TIGR03067 family)
VPEAQNPDASAGAFDMNAANNLEGTWACVSATVDGNVLPNETASLLRLVLTADGYKTLKGSDVLFDSSYTTNASADPKQINMVGTEGDLKGKEAHGIYALEGDSLRICYRMPGMARPNAFTSTPGSKAYLVLWKRSDESSLIPLD